MKYTGDWERAINDALRAGANLHRSLGTLPAAYDTTPSSGQHVPTLRRQVQAAFKAYMASIAELRKVLPAVEWELDRLKSNQRRLANAQHVLRTDAGRRTLEEQVFINPVISQPSSVPVSLAAFAKSSTGAALMFS